MAQFAQLLFSGHFASGMAYYNDHYPGDKSARVVLPVTVEDRLTVQAIVDTGAPWCILAPEIVRGAGAADRPGYEPEEELLTRGGSYKGKLLRMRISLQAEHGKGLEIDATVFVPTLSPGETWLHPNFIGLDGFLTRIRFAVDPNQNAFYFGYIR